MDCKAAVVSPPQPAVEANPSALSPASQPPQILPPVITVHQSNTSFKSVKLESLSPKGPSPSAIVKSIAALDGLSNAIAAFRQCYDDLQNQIDSIKTSILSNFPRETPDIEQFPLASRSLPTRSSSELLVSEETVLPKQQPEQTPQISELEGLCKTMCSRGLRKYLATNLSHLSKLREVLPKALKLSPNPPKLVLECVGKFFLQGSKAFARNPPIARVREASILMLECFLLMMGVGNENDNVSSGIEKSVKAQAVTAALSWRKRMVSEGGLANANQIDARWLLLYVTCFGIPDALKREDIRDLMIAANAKEFVGLLQNSRMLMNIIPEIVKGMIKNKMEVDAVDIAYTFGLEEQFNPQTILASFLHKSKEAWKKPKMGSQGSLNEANTKQLVALKSIRNCLEKHKVDPAKLLPELQINEMIATLEKEVSESDIKSEEKTLHKRKVSDAETSKRSKKQEAKRSRRGPQHHQMLASGHIDSRRSPRDIGLSGHAKNYSATPSVIHGGPGAGLPPGSMIPPGVGAAGLSSNHSSVLSAVSYPGVQGPVLVDSHGPQPYVWHREMSIQERYGVDQSSSYGLATLYRVPTSVEGFTGMPNATLVGSGRGQGTASDLYQFADSVVNNQSHPSSIPRAVAPSHLYEV